jgi:hypothetical protein
MTSYTSPFTGNVIQPTDVSLTTIDLTTENLQTQWPINGDPDLTMIARITEVTSGSALFNLRLPPANQASVGEDILMRNVGAEAFTVQDFDGINDIVTINPGQARYIYISENDDEQGLWHTFTFGAGTSAVDAAALAGNGLVALDSKLNQSLPIVLINSNYVIQPTDRANLIIWVGGAGVFTLLTGGLYGPDWFVNIRNNGTGLLTITTTSGTINGAVSISLQPTDSCFIGCDGTNFYTVGLGKNTQFNFSQLVKQVSGGTYTLTPSEASNTMMKFVSSGNLTSNVVIVLPPTIQVYFVQNATTSPDGFTIRLTTNTGGADAIIPAGEQATVINDSINIVNANSISAGPVNFALPDGSAAAPAMYFATEPTTGVYRPGPGRYGFTILGTQVGEWGASILRIIGSLAFLGIGRRITGNLSDAVVANRLLFQNSIANAASGVEVIPNGTGTSSNFTVNNNSDPDNGSIAQIVIDINTAVVRSGRRGTGAFLPLSFQTSDVERLIIGADGTIALIGNLNWIGASRRIQADFSANPINLRTMFQTSVVNGGSNIEVIPNGTGVQSSWIVNNNSDPLLGSRFLHSITTTAANLISTRQGAAPFLPISFQTSDIERMNIGVAGEVTCFGNLVFSGASRRILGDFSSLPLALRTLFQTTVANTVTSLETIPSGTGTGSNFVANNNADPDNGSRFLHNISSTQAILNSTRRGTGAFLPISFLTSDIERMNIGVAGETTLFGNLIFSGASRRIQADFSTSTPNLAQRTMFQSSTVNGITNVEAMPNGTGAAASFGVYTSTDPQNSSRGQMVINAGGFDIISSALGSGSVQPIRFFTSGLERLNIAAAGGANAGTVTVLGTFNVNSSLNVTGGATFSNSVSIIANYVGVELALVIQNTDNTNPASNARQVIQTGGAAGGDPYTVYFIPGVKGYSVGIDRTDGAKFKICGTIGMGGVDVLTIDNAGLVTIPNNLTVVGALSAGSLAFTNLSVSGTLTVGGAATVGYLNSGIPVIKTADFTVGANENWIICNKPSTSIIVTMPSAAAFPGRQIRFLSYMAVGNVQSSANNIANPSNGGLTNLIVTSQAGSATVVSDGSVWRIMGA